MTDLARILAVLGLVGANAFFVVGEYAVSPHAVPDCASGPSWAGPGLARRCG